MSSFQKEEVVEGEWLPGPRELRYCRQLSYEVLGSACDDKSPDCCPLLLVGVANHRSSEWEGGKGAARYLIRYREYR